MSEVILELLNIKKNFGDTEVLKGINLKVNKGEFITLLGSSGCGKTTTLRIIAGLEVPTSGKVILEGKDVTEIVPNKRNVNTVFQNYALFPHMTVEANIGYSLKIRNEIKSKIEQEVSEALKIVQLEGYGKRYPSELSGGQRQRVAIARAIINNPKVLLLDEPLGALDLYLRRQMQHELKRLQKQLNITFIYITHDQEEALNMSDRIAVMRNGLFEQIGTPEEIYDSPKTSYIASFVGMANIIKGKVIKKEDNIVTFETPDGFGESYCKCPKMKIGDDATVAVRSENIEIEKFIEGKENTNGLIGTIKEKSFAGGMLRIAVSLKNDLEIIASKHGIDSPLKPNDEVILNWKPSDGRLVDLKDEENEKEK